MLAPSPFSYWVVRNFKEWVGKFENYDEYETLQSFIMQWIVDEGFRLIDEYSSFTEAFLILVDAYERDPSILDYLGEPHEGGRKPRVRRVSRLLDLQTITGAQRLMDRRLVNVEICRRRR